MILLVPLLCTVLAVRFGAARLAGRGARAAEPWATWRAASAAGMAVVFVCGGVTHFTEPQRSGLEAVVPDFVPYPALAVTLSGLVEFALAACLLVPRTRPWAAAAAVLFLLLLFPANVAAAAGVDHPAAPSTPLVPRALLQVVFIGFSAAVFLPLRDRKPALAGVGGDR